MIDHHQSITVQDKNQLTSEPRAGTHDMLQSPSPGGLVTYKTGHLKSNEDCGVQLYENGTFFYQYKN